MSCKCSQARRLIMPMPFSHLHRRDHKKKPKKQISGRALVEFKAIAVKLVDFTS